MNAAVIDTAITKCFVRALAIGVGGALDFLSGKLQRAQAAAELVGADTVVVHPPFRWQRDYARLRSLNEGGVRYANDSTSAYWSFTPQVQEWLFVPLVSK